MCVWVCCMVVAWGGCWKKCVGCCMRCTSFGSPLHQPAAVEFSSACFGCAGDTKKTGDCSNLGGGQSFAQHRCHIERVLLTPLRVCVPLVSVSHCDNQCELLAGVAVRRACASSCGGSWFECLCGAGCIPQTAGCVFPHADNRTGSSGCACTSFSSVGVRVCWAALCRVCCSGRVCWIHTLL